MELIKKLGHVWLHIISESYLDLSVLILNKLTFSYVLISQIICLVNLIWKIYILIFRVENFTWQWISHVKYLNFFVCTDNPETLNLMRSEGRSKFLNGVWREKQLKLRWTSNHVEVIESPSSVSFTRSNYHYTPKWKIQSSTSLKLGIFSVSQQYFNMSQVQFII